MKQASRMIKPANRISGAMLLSLVIWLVTHTVAVADPASPRHHVWNKTPIKIVLPVNVEKRIEFPAPIADLKIPAPIADPVSRIQLTPDGRLYWLATLPWETQRVMAQTADGYVYLLDVQASEEYGEPNPLIIEHPATLDASKYAPEKISPKRGYDYVDLSRYAAQHMHGPARLIKPLPGVTRRPVKHQRIDHLFRGDQLSAVPVAQWRSPKPVMYVTAVKVTNKMSYAVPLEPLRVRGADSGAWLFAASHHGVVDAKGRPGDTSFWYLISKRPFAEVINRIGTGMRKVEEPLEKQSRPHTPPYSSGLDDAIDGYEAMDEEFCCK